MPAPQKSLEDSTIALMIGVALFFDAVQALLSYIFIGWLAIPVAYLTFFLWFKMHGLSFFSLKRSAWLGLGAVGEVATAGIIPSFTFVVARIVLDYRIRKIAGV